MARNNLIAWLLTGLVILIPTIGTAQADDIKTAMTALQAETGKLGAPKIQGKDLYFVDTKASSDVVAAVVKSKGGVATLFARIGDQYPRVATTVKKEDGSSAVGTALAANSPA